MADVAGTPRELIAWLYEQDRDAVFEVNRRRKRRSLTQNAYYWAMLNQLARKLGMPDSEVHLNMLREYGVCDVVALAAEVPVGDYLAYWDELHVDFIDGREMRVVKAYKRSKRMDSAEFSRLVDGMRQECEQQGIPVATPEEIARMRFVEPR